MCTYNKQVYLLLLPKKSFSVPQPISSLPKGNEAKYLFKPDKFFVCQHFLTITHKKAA